MCLTSPRLVRSAQNRVLAIDHKDLDYIQIDFQARLQFGDVEVIIECPFVLTVDNVARRLDPDERAGLGPLLALYPASLSAAYVSERAGLHLTFDSGATIVVPQHVQYEAWQVHDDKGWPGVHARHIGRSRRVDEFVKACSPGWTRTSNPSVNSRMLCQLSYRGLLSRDAVCRGPRDDSSARAARLANMPPPAHAPASEAGWNPSHRRLGGAL